MAVKQNDLSEQPAVTRISARDTDKPSKKSPSKTAAGRMPDRKKLISFNPLVFVTRIVLGVGGYFKGAWQELRQVRWPNRRATWGMTGALLGFTAFFVVFILLIDALFQYLFKLMLG